MIQIEREKLEKVLDALEVEYRMYEAIDPETGAPYNMVEAITIIKDVLAQKDSEPVAWLSTDSIGERYLCFDKPLDNDLVQPLYTKKQL